MLVGKFSLDEIKLAVFLQVIDSVKNGCTASVDHLSREYAALDASLSAYSQTGFRAYVAPMIGDKTYDQGLPFAEDDLTPEERAEFSSGKPRPAADILAEVEELIKKWHGYGGLLGVMVGPSNPQRCSDELLWRSTELAEKYNVGFHTHLLETKIQAATGHYLYGKATVAHLADLGVLSPRVSLVHAVWLDDKEIDLIAEHKATVVHNPVSNLTLGSGIAPLLKYRAADVNIALGTDGSSCGGNQSLVRSMCLAAILPRVSTPDYDKWPTAAEVFNMATEGGAQVLLAGDRLGSLAPGKAADLVVINLLNTTYQPLNDPVEQLVYGETGSGVEMVMINGNIIMEQGRLKTVDEELVLKEASKIATFMATKRDSWLEKTRAQFQLVDKLYKKHWAINN
ncbi:MAG: amidohydrolase family protein [Clostridia bacterium]|nr:amidohydrolase family protein [Clostridia bacterium]